MPPTTAADQTPAPLESQRSLPTPFLTKTYQLVDDPSVDDIISWNEDGSTFVVWRPAEFARDLLPKYFKHNNFSSFVRQLNTYGFRKIVPDRWEFSNDCFRRGEKGLLCDIHRRKIAVATAPPAAAVAIAAAPIPVAIPVPVAAAGSPTNSGEEQVLSSNSSPGLPPPVAAAAGGGGGDLREENERLRRENAQLSHELSQMKNLCNNIVHLMSKYAASQGGPAAVVPPPVAAALELLPQRPPPEGEASVPEGFFSCPMLFGVSIGAKRGRGGDGEYGAQGGEVKSEPLDDSGSDPMEADDDRPWLSVCSHPDPNQRVGDER